MFNTICLYWLTKCLRARGLSIHLQIIERNVSKKCILVLHPSLLPSDVSLQQFSSRGTESLSVIRSVVMPSIQTKTLAKTPYLCLISYHGLISSTLIATVVLQVYFFACKLFSCSYVQGGLKNGVYNQFRRNVTSRCYNLSDQT